jgi:hypothetical protein
MVLPKASRHRLELILRDFSFRTIAFTGLAADWMPFLTHKADRRESKAFGQAEKDLCSSIRTRH